MKANSQSPHKHNHCVRAFCNQGFVCNKLNGQPRLQHGVFKKAKKQTNTLFINDLLMYPKVELKCSFNIKITLGSSLLVWRGKNKQEVGQWVGFL